MLPLAHILLTTSQLLQLLQLTRTCTWSRNDLPIRVSYCSADRQTPWPFERPKSMDPFLFPFVKPKYMYILNQETRQHFAISSPLLPTQPTPQSLPPTLPPTPKTSTFTQNPHDPPPRLADRQPTTAQGPARPARLH